MTDFDNDLIAGIAQLLADAGVGAWEPTGIYQSTDTAITQQILPQSPDNALALSTYPVSDDPALSDSVIGLQVFTRAAGEDPRPTNTLASGAYDQLHGLHDFNLSTGVHIVLGRRQSGSVLGQDERRRWERVDNYYLTVHRPSPNRT